MAKICANLNSNKNLIAAKPSKINLIIIKKKIFPDAFFVSVAKLFLKFNMFF